MSTQNISAQLTPADMQTIKNNLATIRQLLPFLVVLSALQRQRLFKMGSSLGFVQDALTAAKNNPDILPASFNTADFEKNIQLAVLLNEIRTTARQLCSDLDDTCLAVGSQANEQSTTVYQYAKTAVKTQPGLKPIVGQLGARFAKTRKPKAAAKAA